MYSQLWNFSFDGCRGMQVKDRQEEIEMAQDREIETWKWLKYKE